MSANQNPPKRPRLSLQIKAISSGPNLRASRTIAAVVNPTSPTSFNTLSNVYATAIDRSTPVTAINTKQPLKIQTQSLAGPHDNPYHGAATPFAAAYPDTPLTAQPVSPAIASLQDFRFPSTMTATPPLSAGPVDASDASNRAFSFAPADTSASRALPPTTSSSSSSTAANTLSPTTAEAAAAAAAGAGGGGGGPTTPSGAGRRRATAPPSSFQQLHQHPGAAPPPYVRNRSLHSILRNSPLPPPSARTPISPRRQSQRLAERAARRVGYESPIERVIVTEQYVHSHIDLLLSPSPSTAVEDPSSSLSLSLAASAASSSSSDPILGLPGGAGDDADATRDGGMTPGPFEEMRRRMAGLVTRTPTSPTGGGGGGGGLSSCGSPAGVRKRRKRESRRRWVWTIGTSEDEDDEARGGVAEAAGGTVAVAASPAPAVVGSEPMVLSPMDVATPSVEVPEQADVVMSGSEAESEPPEAGAGADVAEGKVTAMTCCPGSGPDMDVDMATPTVARRGGQAASYAERALLSVPRSTRQDSEGLYNAETGSRRDTPVPADLVAGSGESA